MASVLFITDAEVVRRIDKERKARGDKTATKTATKVLLEYFTLVDHGVITENKRAVAARQSKP